MPNQWKSFQLVVAYIVSKVCNLLLNQMGVSIKTIENRYTSHTIIEAKDNTSKYK